MIDCSSANVAIIKRASVIQNSFWQVTMEAECLPSSRDSDLDEDNSPPQTFQVNQHLPLPTTQLPGGDNLFPASNSESVDECDNYRDPRSGTYYVLRYLLDLAFNINTWCFFNLQALC